VSRSVKARVVFIAPTPAPYRAVFYDELCRRCPEYDFLAIFQEPSLSEMQWERDLPHAMESVSLDPLPVGPARRLPMIQRVNRGVPTLLESYSADVLVTHAFGTITGRTICRWARRHDVPFFLRCDTNENRELAKPRWQRILRSESFKWEMQFASGAMTIGTSNEAFYARNGLDKERQFRVPFMIDSEQVARHAEQERATGDLRRRLGVQAQHVILFVGRIVRGKGVIELLEAYLSLREVMPDVDLVIVGSGPLEQILRDRSGSLLGSRIHMAGFLQPDDVSRSLGLGDVLVAASHAEPWGIVINEAMAAGTPVIATESGGAASDLLIEGVNGRLVPPGDPNAIRDCLLDMLADTPTLHRMGERARGDYARWISVYDPIEGFRRAMSSALSGST
jgi:glycosyltransferase involved in cell wall biosynthesis